MFNNSKNTANWFPGQAATRDRWGDPIGSEVVGREYRQGNATAQSATQRLRWSLGHA